MWLPAVVPKSGCGRLRCWRNPTAAHVLEAGFSGASRTTSTVCRQTVKVGFVNTAPLIRTNLRNVANFCVARQLGNESLLNPRIFRLRLQVDGNVRVGILPQGQEVFIRRQCTDAGGVGIRAGSVLRLQGIGARHAEVRKRSRPAVTNNSAVGENLLELSRSRHALNGREVRLATHVACGKAGQAVQKV